jgi:prolyl-tRNA editing enzyme YbaK/EbsC (Cys-tRNA(Pro) deacylase)
MAKIPATTRFTEAAAQFGFVPTIERFPADTRTAEQAAAALGCAVEQIVKSLIFLVDDEPLLVLASGAHRVDMDLLAERVTGKVTRADANAVRAATGFAIGGVPPFGHTTDLCTMIDPHILTLSSVWAAAGAPDSVFLIESSELLEITSAEPVGCFSS